MTTASERWWQSATGYQIYPRSFCDSNGDGVGDIPGIISRLDHLADLGIGFIWLSPVYASPMADMGYDIADYQAIAPEFGTMADMDRLIAEARTRGIGIVMDLVVNHSSDRHAWFQAALRDRDAPEHDLYIWRDPDAAGEPPDDHQACFGGPAWHWAPSVGRYYYGHFSAAQPDLNWQNPALRARIYDMMRWWLDRGIAGFRMDVISLIGKDVDARLYEEGPHLHRFLREMRREVLAGRDVVTIGESWSVSTDTALLYCGRRAGTLDMVFQFNHVTAGWHPELGKWKPKPRDLVALKRVLFEWQAALSDDGWNSLFLSNHDLPRQVSVYGDDGADRVASAKALATALHLMKGTPFVYQGEEFGMTNARFTSIGQYRDIETLGHYAEQTASGVTPEAFIAGANVTSRDNARTPMQWSDAPHGGFTRGTPWIEVNPNYREINVAADRAAPDGVFAHYRHLIALRRELAIVRHGRLEPFLEDHAQVMAYARHHDDAVLIVLVNLSGAPVEITLPARLARTGAPLVATHGPRDLTDGTLRMAPWEALATLSGGSPA